MDKRREAEYAEDMNVLNKALRGMSDLQKEWDEEEAAEKAAAAKDKEIAILREFVSFIRDRYVKRECACYIMKSYVCERCFVIDRIDTDLAKIAEAHDE